MSVIHSVLAVSLGKHPMHRKTSGRKENRQREAFPSRRRATLFRMAQSQTRQDLKYTVPQGLALVTKSQEPWVSPCYSRMVFTLFHNFRMDPGASCCLLDWYRVRKWSHFVSQDSNKNPFIWLSWGIHVFIRLLYYCLLISLAGVCSSPCCAFFHLRWHNLKYWVWGEETGTFNFRCIVLFTSHKQVGT